MNLKTKNWLWYFTFPFAHKNYTTIGNNLYYPKGRSPSQSIVNHEMIHYYQQKKVGILKFLFLYIFGLPIFWNPWRYKWEYEAFLKGSKWNHNRIVSILKSYKYGWL